MNVHLGLAPSIAAARRALAAIFRDSGLDTPDLDARVIIGHALGLEHAALAAQSDRAIPAEAGERIRALAARRIAREPVARIVGAKEFWSLKFSISPAVLVHVCFPRAFRAGRAPMRRLWSARAKSRSWPRRFLPWKRTS